MDTATFQAELKRDGFNDIETKSQPANRFNAAHSHPFEVRLLVTAGEATLVFNGTTRTYRAGDILTMAPGCEHTEQYGPAGWTYIVGKKVPQAA